MNLLVIRHAAAEEISQTGQDKDRPLSAKGRDSFNQFCKNLSFLDLKFDLLLESHLLRAKQTADIFCQYFSVSQKDQSNNLDPLSKPESLLLELSSYNLSFIALIGHQPFLGRFMSFCLTADESAFILLKRGAMALLDFPLAIQSGSAQLKSLLDPKYFIKK